MTAAAAARDIVFLLLVAGAGSLFVVRAGVELTVEEAIGWSWATGTLFLAGAYAVLLVLHASPGPRKLGAPLLLLAAASLALRKPVTRPGDPYRGLSLLLAGVALAGILLYALQACAEPLWSTDFLAIWGLKGKTIYFTGAVPERLFRNPATAWSHPEYPLFLPLLTAAFSAATGGWNDEALGLIDIATQIATALVVAGYCRRRAHPVAGAVTAALVALWYPLYRAFGTGLAEIPFALSLVLLATAAADGAVARGALAAFLCCATKQEGTIFSLLLAAALVLRRGRPPSARRAALAIAIAAVGHFALLRLARGELHDRDFTWSILSNAPELFARLGRLARALAGAWGPGELLGLAALVGVLLLTRRSRENFLLLPLAGQIVVYLGACALSAWDPVWQLRSAFFRIAATLVPPLAIVVGGRLGQEPLAAPARASS